MRSPSIVFDPHTTRSAVARRVVARGLVAAGVLAAGVATAAQEPAPAPPPTPCEDFNAHANAAWLADPQAPASVFAELQALSLQRQRELLDALAAGADDEAGRQLGTFWRAAGDEDAIERAGLAAVKPWLDRIDGMRKPRDVAELIAQAHATGLPLLLRFDIGTDLREPTRTVAYARQGGLGLPDRDYYLRDDPTTEALRTHYRAYVTRLLTLSGTPAEQATRDVAAIMDIETRLARASLSLVQLRDPNNSYYPTDVREADKRFASLDWKGFLRANGLRQLRWVSLAHTAFFVEADHLVGALPLDQWRAYLRFHALHALAPHLPRAYRDAHHALFAVQLHGAGAAPEHWRTALRATDDALGEWLGERYASRHLDADREQRARAIATGLVVALREGINASDWLSTAARAAADAKLAASTIVVGHADALPGGKLPALSPTDHAGNVLAIAGWRHRAAMAAAGEAPQPAPLRGHHVNAFYDPVGNRLAVSAAMLADPVLADRPDPASDHGALGTLLGHELAHAVDPHGATLDAEGKAATWWTAEDYQAFTARTKALVEQYNAYPVLADVHVDGRRTWLENLADLAGLELAWAAWRNAEAASPADAAPTDTAVEPAAVETAAVEATAVDTAAVDAGAADPAARFFHSYARTWRQRLDSTELRLALATDIHAPPPFRVLGPLAHSAAFAETFDCKAGEGFLHSADTRVRVWR